MREIVYDVVRRGRGANVERDDEMTTGKYTKKDGADETERDGRFLSLAANVTFAYLSCAN